MKIYFLQSVIAVLLIHENFACHEIQHIYRKKRNSDSEDPLNVLLTFFTDCMTERSNITFDWFSATDWAIEDSNWYYYSNTLDCANDKTECWQQRVDLFLDETISPTVKNCISSFSEASDTYTESKLVPSLPVKRRKKRRAVGRGLGRSHGLRALQVGAFRNRRSGNTVQNQQTSRVTMINQNRQSNLINGNQNNGNQNRQSNPTNGNQNNGNQNRQSNPINGSQNRQTNPNVNNVRNIDLINNKNKPRSRGNQRRKVPRNPRNSECPPISPKYRRMLRRMIPQNFRPHRRRPQRNRRNNVEWVFNISSVVDFVEKYTKCEECMRYSGRKGTLCYTDRLDRLTRNNSPLKSFIQTANSAYATGKILEGDCQNTYWTPWFDIDNPSEGIGDHESFEKIKKRFPDQVCLNPMGVQAEVNDSSEITAEEHSVFEISPSSGLICLNQNQTYGQCLNYKIRFCCKDYFGECTMNTHGWTRYFDEQDPTPRGDFEVLSPRLLNKFSGEVCRNPTGIGGRSLTSNRTYLLTGEIVHAQINRGLFCLAGQQPDRRCEDYQVRYCCSAVIGNCDQNHYWTEWFDTSSTYEGDIETLDVIKKHQRYNCSSEPTAIEAQIADTERPYIEGRNKLSISPTRGLLCNNSLQENGPCKNYRVRFCCEQRNRHPTPSPLSQETFFTQPSLTPPSRSPPRRFRRPLPSLFGLPPIIPRRPQPPIFG